MMQRHRTRKISRRCQDVSSVKCVTVVCFGCVTLVLVIYSGGLRSDLFKGGQGGDGRAAVIMIAGVRHGLRNLEV
jgi:hypothetical protein